MMDAQPGVAGVTTEPVRITRRHGIDIAHDIAESLRRALSGRLIAVVLFGSRARDDAEDISDWDVLVLAEGLPTQAFDRHVLLKEALPPTVRGAASLVAKTLDEFEARVPALYLDIALDGRIVYDPTGYAADRLDRLRGIIQRAGLRREHSSAGDTWRWDSPPPRPWRLSWDG